MPRNPQIVIVPLLSFLALALFGHLLWTIAKVDELFSPVAEPAGGVLAVTEPMFSTQVHSVEGEWAFYSGVLVDPVLGTAEGSALPVPTMVAVPWPWKRDRDGASDNQTQAGTYHLQIDGLQVGVVYGLFLKEVASAYRAYVDGELVASRGRAETDPALYRAEVGARTALFTARQATTDLVIQVVDRTTSLGGLWQKVYLGRAQPILDLHARAAQRDLFFLAGLTMLAVFQWILAFVIRRDRASFFLAIFCTAVLLKSAFSEMMFGFTWFPRLDYEGGMMLAYLGIIVMIPVFLSYTRRCFPEESWASVTALAWVPSLVEAGLVFFTPFEFYQDHFVWFQVVMVLGCLLILVTGIWALVRRREGAVLFLLGFVVVFVAGINDILFSNQLIQTGYALNVGLFYFLLAQAAIIAQRYRSALVGVEEMSRDLETKVADRTRELAEERNAFEQLSKEDGLTGLFNKRHLNEVLDTEFEAFKRYGHGFSVLMIDLDWFKRINDTHGHLCGDQILAELGRMFKANLRKSDLVARFGGEEFVVIMRNTHLEEATRAAENLRKVVESASFDVEGAHVGITISIGVAEVTAETVNEGELIKRADDALYLAKATGRNRVVTR